MSTMMCSQEVSNWESIQSIGSGQNEKDNYPHITDGWLVFEQSTSVHVELEGK